MVTWRVAHFWIASCTQCEVVIELAKRNFWGAPQPPVSPQLPFELLKTGSTRPLRYARVAERRLDGPQWSDEERRFWCTGVGLLSFRVPGRQSSMPACSGTDRNTNPAGNRAQIVYCRSRHLVADRNPEDAENQAQLRQWRRAVSDLAHLHCGLHELLAVLTRSHQSTVSIINAVRVRRRWWRWRRPWCRRHRRWSWRRWR